MRQSIGLPRSISFFLWIFCRDCVLGDRKEQKRNRTYKVLGNVDLADSVWIEVGDNVELYRFFKVAIEMK